MRLPAKFILVDDDSVDNYINNTVIKNTYNGAEVIKFENPLHALQYINDFLLPGNGEKAVLLLDINMPGLSGWDFMVELEKMGHGVFDKLRIFILSSSVDSRDIEKAKLNLHISDFISKPLGKEKLETCFVGR